MMYNANYSFFGLIILILDIIAIVDILKSNSNTTTKVLWVLAVLFFPIGGMILYYLFGKK